MPILDTTKLEFTILASKQLYPKRFNSLTARELTEFIIQIATPHYYFGKIAKPENEIVYHLANFLKEAHPMLMVGDIHALLSLSSRKEINKIGKIDIETFSAILPKYETILIDLILKMNDLVTSKPITQ
jgi:hypothetical protein